MRRAFAAVIAAGLASCGGGDGGSPGSEVTAAECSNGLDDDGDGTVDCLDLACSVHTFCMSGDAGPPPPVDSGPPPPVDSGPPPPADSGPGGCTVTSTTPDNCPSSGICICPDGGLTCAGTGTCSSAFGRRYVVTVSSLRVPERDPAGECWDALCDGPDPFVQVRVDGTVVGTTPTVNTTYNVTWSPAYTVEVTIAAGSDLRLDAYDEDVTEHDGILACVHEPIDAARLRARTIGCTGALGELVATIEPK